MPEEEKLIEERKEKLVEYLLNKKIFFGIVGLIILLFLAWHIRTANIEGLKDITTGGYTLGPDLDPFLFLRYAKSIVESGSLMTHDSMRYVPLGYDTSKETRLLPYMIVYFHKFINIFSEKSLEYSADLFPAFMFLLTAIAFFLFVRKVFEEKESRDIIALVSSAFLIVAPSLVARTVAGIPEKESVGFFFMALAFYFFLSSWKSETKNKSFILAFLAGLSTALMGLVWGGWIYIFTTIAVFVFIAFMCGKVDVKRFISYCIWIIVSFAVFFLSSERFSLLRLITSTAPALATIVFLLFLVDFLIFRTKIKDISLIANLRKKIPDKIISIIFLLIIGSVVSSLILGIGFTPSFIKDIFSHLTQPYTDRLSFTVAENKQPYFSEWKESFGPNIKGIPFLFWLFFTGSIFLFYDSVKYLEKKGRLLLLLAYILFLFGLVFSRYSPSSFMNGTNLASKTALFGSLVLFVASSCYLFYKYYKENNFEELKKINFSFLFLIVLFFVCLIGARSAIRLIMVLSVPAVIIVGYFCVSAIEKFREQKDENLKIVLGVIAFIVIVASLYSFYYNYNVAIGSARGMVPSAYTQQWQRAMAWVRDNTQQDAVFSHWWDYGYWIQTMGERATVLDGGNAIAYWDHLLGRHVLTGQNEIEALEFLYTHNATHLLIDSTEIGKYSAYSSIGSDENYDRFSQMSVILEDDKSMQETKQGVLHVYPGSILIDQDYLWKADNENLFFPAFKSGIGGVIVEIDDNNTVKQPTAIFIVQGKQTNIPMKCAYYKGEKFEFENGYGGCLYIIPRIVSQGQGLGISNTGAALFVSEKSMKALWVKLYLFDSGENFKLAHKQQNFFVEDIKNQGADVGDFVLYGDILGPIKIWEINYPSNVNFKPEYLVTRYPDKKLEIAKNVF